MKNKKLIIVIGIVYLILMGYFTFNDLKIALWIYNPGTAYAKVFEFLGTIPMPIMGIFACIAFMLCTMIARMMDGMHYATDVLTGAVVVRLHHRFYKDIF